MAEPVYVYGMGKPPWIKITDEEREAWREWGKRVMGVHLPDTDEPQDIPGLPTPGPAETKIVRIHWKDACSVQGWHFKHEIEEQGLSLVESVGWLVGEDDSCVKLAISVSDGVAGNMTIIPKSGIVDRWEFKGE